MASCPASQSMSLIRRWGMLRQQVQWSRSSVDFALSDWAFLFQDVSLPLPIQRFQKKIEFGWNGNTEELVSFQSTFARLSISTFNWPHMSSMWNKVCLSWCPQMWQNFHVSGLVAIFCRILCIISWCGCFGVSYICSDMAVIPDSQLHPSLRVPSCISWKVAMAFVMMTIAKMPPNSLR